MLHDRLIACGTFRDLVFFRNQKVFKVVKRAHSGWINGIINVQIPGNCNRLVTGGGKTIKLWDLEVFKCLEKIGKHKSSINCLSSCDITKKGDWFFASGSDFPESSIRVFSYKSLSLKYKIDINRSVREIKSFNTGKNLLVLEGSLSNMAGSLVNYKTGSVNKIAYARVKSIEVISKKKFVIGLEGGEFNVFSRVNENSRTPLQRASFEVTVGGLVTHLENGKFLSFNVYNQTIKFLRPITGTEDGESDFPLRFSQGYDDMILLKYCPEEEVVITSTKDCIVRVWKLTNNRSKISMNNLLFDKTESFVKSVALISTENELKVTQPRIEFISNLIINNVEEQVNEKTLKQEEEEEEESEGEGKEKEKNDNIISHGKNFCKINEHIFFPKYILFDPLDDLSKLNLNKIRKIFFDEEDSSLSSNEPELLFLRVIFGIEPKKIGLKNITKLIRIFFHLNRQVNMIKSCVRYIYDHRFKEFEEFYVIDDDDEDTSEKDQFFTNVLRYFKTNLTDEDEEEELYKIIASQTLERNLPSFSQVYRNRLKGIYERIHRQETEKKECLLFDHNLILEIQEKEEKEEEEKKNTEIVSRVYVHKEVLIFGSSFFFQLFSFQSHSSSTHDDEEEEEENSKKKKKIQCLKIELLKEEEVKKIIEFCYLGSFKEEEEQDNIIRSLIGILVHSEMYMDTSLKTYTLSTLKKEFERRWKNENHEIVKRKMKGLVNLMTQQLPKSIQLEIIHFWMERFGISKKQMDILLGKVIVKRKKLKKRGEEEEEEEKDKL